MELDQFQTSLDPNLLVVQIRECALQILPRLFRISGPLLRNSQQRLDSPQIGLQLQRGAHVRYRLGVIALKEQQHAEVCLRIEVFRIERNDFSQHRNGELWLLFLKVFLGLLFESRDLGSDIRSILRDKSHTGQQTQNRATKS